MAKNLEACSAGRIVEVEGKKVVEQIADVAAIDKKAKIILFKQGLAFPP